MSRLSMSKPSVVVSAVFAVLCILVVSVRANTQCSGQCSNYACPSGDDCVIDYNGYGDEYCGCQSSSNAGVIAGSIIGAVVFVCIIVCLIGLCVRQRTYYGGYVYGQPQVVELQGGRVFAVNGGQIISAGPQQYSPQYIPTGIPVGSPVPVIGSPVYGQQPHYAQPPPNNPQYAYSAPPPSSPPAYTGQSFKTSDPEFPELDKTRSNGATYAQPPEQ